MLLLLYALIMLSSLVLRVININYNTPFTDEAIYIVLGKLGVFQFDWSSYNASNWVAGNIYMYPTLTALSYSIFGIIGSRLLNVMFDVLSIDAIFRITKLISKESTTTAIIGGLIAAAISAGSAISLYVSRLATYDIPSFYFLLLSIVVLLYAQRQTRYVGKWYFLSAVFLLISFAFKIITGIYLPFVVLVSYLSARKLGELHLFFWKRYFITTVAAGLLVYFLISLSGNITYLTSQTHREDINVQTILDMFFNYETYLIGFWIIGSLGMMIAKRWKEWLILTAAALFIVVFHVASHRLTTFDKHLFLTTAFFSIVAGLGISTLIAKMKLKPVRITAVTFIIVLLTGFWIVSYQQAQRFNGAWLNISEIAPILQHTVKPDDKVLTEAGPPVMLALYDQDNPVNFTTFDYFPYRKFNGESAYTHAVEDGYFNIIELENNNGKSANAQQVHTAVSKSINDNYKQIYNHDNFVIYKRAYD